MWLWGRGGRCGGFGGEVGGWEGVADAAVYEDALLLVRVDAGGVLALGVGVVGERGWRRRFEHGAEDGAVGQDAAVVDEAQAGEGCLGGGSGLLGVGGVSAMVVALGIGFSGSC